MVIVDNLVKTYGDFRLDLSLEIRDGAVTGIVGRNGAGKTTLIKALLGLIRPDKGRITINGKEISRLTGKDRASIGVALSESGFSAYLRVKDAAAILKKMYPTFDEEYFRNNCRVQGLAEDKRISEFSTGMKAKLRVLSAISHRASLLVMDEPTAGLDVQARNDILDLLRQYLLENEGCSVLITSHISSDLESLCDDIYLIGGGRILLHEDTDVLLGSYAILKVSWEDFEKLDKSHILSSRKDPFGYVCFTDQKQFYADNYPGIVIENGSIDDLILMMTGGH